MTLRRGAAIAILRQRAGILAQLRAFFAERGVLEVDTASLSAAATPDPAVHSLRIADLVPQLYLHTSPEYMMKRLLAEGSGDIYQLCRVFRNGELGKWHEPEFVMLEWYRTGWDEHALMSEVDSLLQILMGPERLRQRATRVGYDAALLNAIGLTSEAATPALVSELRAQGVEVPEATSHDGVLNLAMATLVCPQLPSDRLTFIHDYPAGQAALARINNGNPPVAARFEVFFGAVELGNGFHELTDAREQRARFERENSARAAAGYQPVLLDESFLSALEAGLPGCAGVALGIDRIMAAALGAESIADVVAFTHAFNP